MTEQKKDEELYRSYKRKVNNENKLTLTFQLIIFISFFGLWEIASRLSWIDPLLFSSPTKVFNIIIKKFSDGTLLGHLQVTILETITGFLLGTILGIIFASILWSSTKLSKVLDPYLVVLNAMPKIALGPILIVAFGPGYLSIIIMGAMVSVIITTLVVYSGFKEVDPNYQKVLISFGASRFEQFKEAIFPANIPTMISTLKVNVGLAWVGVIVGEFLVSKQGLGYLIIYGFQVFDFTLVMASLILIAIVAAIMYKIVEKIEDWLIKHSN